MWFYRQLGSTGPLRTGPVYLKSPDCELYHDILIVLIENVPVQSLLVKREPKYCSGACSFHVVFLNFELERGIEEKKKCCARGSKILPVLFSRDKFHSWFTHDSQFPLFDLLCKVYQYYGKIRVVQSVPVFWNGSSRYLSFVWFIYMNHTHDLISYRQQE